MAEKTEKNTKKNAIKFYKENIINMDRYNNRKDALEVLLDETKEYTREEVDKALDDFLNGKVK